MNGDRNLVRLFAASGALGAVLGAGLAGWHDAVEGGQVIAGIVTYPDGNPMHDLHRSAWTLVNQLPAVPLRLGVPEAGTSMLVGAIVGAMYFQAFSLITWVFSREFLLSLLMPAFLVATRAYWYAPDYDVVVFQATSGTVTEHTHGALGLAVGLYFAALLGAGWNRGAGFVLGLGPAVHVALGGWTIGIAALCAVLARHWRVDGAAVILRYFLAGLAVTLVSFGVHAWMFQDGAAAAPAADGERYLQAFLEIWDTHRQPGVSWRAVLHVLGLAALPAAVLALRASRNRDRDRNGEDLLLLYLAVSAAAAVAIYLTVKLAWDALPLVLIQVIPGRFLDYSIAAGLPLVAGLLLRRRGSGVAVAAVSLLFATPMLAKAVNAAVARDMLPDGLRIDAEVPTVVLLAGCVAAYVLARRDTPPSAPSSFPIRAGRLVVLACALLAVPLLGRTWAVHGSVGPNPFAPDEAAFWTEVGNDPGMLAVPGGMPSAQIFARRPLLIDAAALDFIPYVPGAAGAVDEILDAVYGIDFFDPPPEVRHRGQLLADTSREVWEARSRGEWQLLGERFGFAGVLSHGDWVLDLPVTARADGITYHALAPPRR